MKTRSQTKQVIYDVNIDFDEASTAWKSNKKSSGNGCYTYVCCYISKTGKKCNKKPLLSCDFCKTHNNVNLCI